MRIVVDYGIIESCDNAKVTRSANQGRFLAVAGSPDPATSGARSSATKRYDPSTHRYRQGPPSGPLAPVFPSLPSCTWQRACWRSCTSHSGAQSDNQRREESSTAAKTRALPSATWQRAGQRFALTIVVEKNVASIKQQTTSCRNTYYGRMGCLGFIGGSLQDSTKAGRVSILFQPRRGLVGNQAWNEEGSIDRNAEGFS